mgnify:FL=1
MKTLYCPHCGHIEFVPNHGKVADIKCFECGAYKMFNLRLPTIVKKWLIKLTARQNQSK